MGGEFVSVVVGEFLSGVDGRISLSEVAIFVGVSMGAFVGATKGRFGMGSLS